MGLTRARTPPPPALTRVNGTYRLKEKIGSGAFGMSCGYLSSLKDGSPVLGDVYLAIDIFTRREVAVKVEAVGKQESDLEAEHEIYQQLKECHAVPKVHWFGTESTYNTLVVDLLGPSLEDLLNMHGRSFSLKTIVLLAGHLVHFVLYWFRINWLIMRHRQITCMESVHLAGIVHRDIKPDHFLLQHGSQRAGIQLIDFGLAKPFRHSQTLQHVPYSSSVPFVGTTRYCSLNSHGGTEHSRRDDLESLAYILIYLRRGSLPWQGLLTKSKSLEKKQQISVEQLCSGLPPAFGYFLSYTRGLKFDEDPNYSGLRQSFIDLGIQEGFYLDSTSDWDIHTLHSIDPGLPSPSCPSTLPAHAHAKVEIPCIDRRV